MKVAILLACLVGYSFALSAQEIATLLAACEAKLLPGGGGRSACESCCHSTNWGHGLAAIGEEAACAAACHLGHGKRNLAGDIARCEALRLTGGTSACRTCCDGLHYQGLLGATERLGCETGCSIGK